MQFFGVTSRIYLFFILFFKSSSDTKYPNKSLETIDVNNLNAIDIVTFARQALEQDDLEQVISRIFFLFIFLISFLILCIFTNIYYFFLGC